MRGSAASDARTAEATAMPEKTSTSTGYAPNLSASHPPTGRATVAAMTNPAARALASPFEKSNQSWRTVGSSRNMATKPPNVMK
jgi:hypothetical protein